MFNLKTVDHLVKILARCVLTFFKLNITELFSTSLHVHCVLLC